MLTCHAVEAHYTVAACTRNMRHITNLSTQHCSSKNLTPSSSLSLPHDASCLMKRTRLFATGAYRPVSCWQCVPGVQPNSAQVVHLVPVHCDIVSSQDALCTSGHSSWRPFVPDETANGCVQSIITCTK